MESLSVRLVAHHVGARGFGVSFNVPENFRDEVLHILYDADRESIEKMQAGDGAAHSALLGERRVYPYCIGRSRRAARLNITANAYASSLLEPSPEFLEYYAQIGIGPALYDVSFSDMLEVARRVEVEVRSLDELFADGGLAPDARPDFLSVDTQGYELEVLEGARDTIANSVLGIVCEVEMMPMYGGQPLLGDVLAHLARAGFLFAGYTSYHEVSPYRAPVGLRANSLPGFGDVLFLRDPRALARPGMPVEQVYLMQMKLAFMAVNFAQVELGLLALKHASALRAQVPAAFLARTREMGYIRFLEELEEAAERQEKVYLPIHAVPDDSRVSGDTRTSWYDKHHATALRRHARYGGGPAGREALIRLVLGSPPARMLRRLVPKRLELLVRSLLLPDTVPTPTRTVAPAAAAAGAAATEASSTAPAATQPAKPRKKLAGNYTPFETALYYGGFVEVLNVVRQRRLAAQRYLAVLSPDMVRDAASAHLPRA